MSYDLAVVGIGVSVFSVLFGVYTYSKSNTKELEKRLVTLEQNSFTKEDRVCLSQLDLKMGLFWTIVEEDFPRLLRKMHTPIIDKLLDLAHEKKLENLSKVELEELMKRLDIQYINALELEDSGRAMAIAIYRIPVKYWAGERGNGVCKT